MPTPNCQSCGHPDIPEAAMHRFEYYGPPSGNRENRKSFYNAKISGNLALAAASIASRVVEHRLQTPQGVVSPSRFPRSGESSAKTTT